MSALKKKRNMYQWKSSVLFYLKWRRRPSWNTYLLIYLEGRGRRAMEISASEGGNRRSGGGGGDGSKISSGWKSGEGIWRISLLSQKWRNRSENISSASAEENVSRGADENLDGNWNRRKDEEEERKSGMKRRKRERRKKIFYHISPSKEWNEENEEGEISRLLSKWRERKKIISVKARRNEMNEGRREVEGVCRIEENIIEEGRRKKEICISQIEVEEEKHQAAWRRKENEGIEKRNMKKAMKRQAKASISARRKKPRRKWRRKEKWKWRSNVKLEEKIWKASLAAWKYLCERKMKKTAMYHEEMANGEENLKGRYEEMSLLSVWEGGV